MQRYSGRLQEVVSHENRPIYITILGENSLYPASSLSYDMRSFMLPLKVLRIPLEEKHIPVGDT